MPNPVDVTIGRNVKSQMVLRDVTQMVLASVLKVSQATISDRLAGRTPWKVADLQKVAEHLGVTVDDLLADLPKAGVA